MRRYLHRTLHPELYHGHGRKPPFFEGWYFKLVDHAERQRYAIIPGIFLNKDAHLQHAFIQVLDGMTGQATYHTFRADQFHADEQFFAVQIGANHFSADHIHLDLDDQGVRIHGEVRFNGGQGWPVTPFSPGIMGWYGWIPFMECYHGVVSLDHALTGTLTVNGAALDFTGGRGYIEKDWGQSFPSGYVWMQSNHFDTPATCLTASIAMIPSLGRTFRGFIVGLWQDGTLHRFATYTRAKTELLTISETLVTWVMSNKTHRLELRATRAEGAPLRGPTREEMHKRVDETLKASVEVRLSELGSGRAIFSETGRCAGLEVHGNLQQILSG